MPSTLSAKTPKRTRRSTPNKRPRPRRLSDQFCRSTWERREAPTTTTMTTTTRKRRTMRRRRKRLIPISERAAITNRHKPFGLVVSPERVQKSFLWRYRKELRGLCSLLFQIPFRRPTRVDNFQTNYFSISFKQQYRAIATFQGNSTSEAYFLKRVFDTGPDRLASFYYVATVSAFA